LYISVAIRDAARPTYWMPDEDIKDCCVCRQTFGIQLKVHHCRACGKGVCDECSPSARAVPSRGWDHPVRVCKTCFGKEKELWHSCLTAKTFSNYSFRMLRSGETVRLWQPPFQMDCI